jgi:hypothetical protein
MPVPARPLQGIELRLVRPTAGDAIRECALVSLEAQLQAVEPGAGQRGDSRAVEPDPARDHVRVHAELRRPGDQSFGVVADERVAAGQLQLHHP